MVSSLLGASSAKREILHRLVAVSGETWNYRRQHCSPRSRCHTGPMAHEFATAFSVGENDDRINTVEADGVAFAAIAVLYQIIQEKDDQIGALQAELDTLKQRIESEA